MNVAVLMTCHNRCEITLRCLSSLHEAVGQLERRDEGGQWKFHVFIVDDGSTDGTGGAVREYAEKVKVSGEDEQWCKIHLIQGDGSLYWAKGMALAWRTALESETNHQQPFSHFLWLNDDTILHSDALISLSRLVEANSNAVIAGSLIDEATGLKICGVKEDGLFTGNFVFIPRSAYEKAGMIYGRFHHAWADSDYAMRCRRTGVQVVELEGVGMTRAHDLRPELLDVSLLGRIRLLFDPKGWCVHDLWLYRRRNWGICVAVASAVHFVFHVLWGER